MLKNQKPQLFQQFSAFFFFFGDNITILLIEPNTVPSLLQDFKEN